MIFNAAPYGAVPFNGAAPDGAVTVDLVCPVRISVSAIQDIECPVSLSVVISTVDLVCPSSIAVVATTETPACPVRLSVHGMLDLGCPVRIGVVDSLTARRWDVSIVLGGVDVSARLVGSVRVDGEEGAARLAEFGLVPFSGAVSPLSWTGSLVRIDFVRLSGSDRIAARLFTGKVDMAAYDPASGILSFSCTNDLQNLVAALAIDDIDTLCAGTYSEAVNGTIDDRWDYAQARMASRCASLDADPYGALRVTDWAGAPAWLSVAAADVLDASVSVDLPRRSEIVNVVRATMEYRYYRLRERRASAAYSQSQFGTDALACGYTYPSLDSLQSAVGGAGWTILSQSWSPAPARIPYGLGYVVPNGGVSYYTAQIAQRHSQTVTETHRLVVSAPASVTNNGALAQEIRGSLATTWSPDGWESDLTMAPVAWPDEIDHAPEADRAAADAAMQVLIDQARATILASHRQARVTWQTPCQPELDTNLGAALAAAGVTASGKIAGVVHNLDLSTGSALTQVTLALSGIDSGGLVVETPLAPPDQPEVDVGVDVDYTFPHLGLRVAGRVSYSDSLMGWLVNTPATITVQGIDDGLGGTRSESVANPWYAATGLPVTGFRARLPGVADNYRDPIEIAADSAYEVAIPTDPLALEAP